MPSRPAIVYIGGYGRSGSSLLGLVLGQHPDVFHAGEIGPLAWACLHDRACSCGAALDRCPVWSGAVRALRADPRGVVDRRTADARTTRAAMGAVAGHGEVPFVVDGSKTAVRHLHRPLLYRWLGYEVYFIHLVRSPEAVVRSALRGRNSRLEAHGDRRVRRGEVAITLAGWCVANLASRAWRTVFGRRAVHLTYEALCADPRAALGRLSQVVPIDLGAVVDHVEAARPLVVGHEVGGNRMLRGAEVVMAVGPLAPPEPLPGLAGRACDLVRWLGA